MQAMRRWPDVPAVYGWLRLDGRGAWRIRGERVTHAPTVAFIARNYLSDPRGRWFFQNGPQRVYVDLDRCPWVLSIDDPTAGAGPSLKTHAGQLVEDPRAAWVTGEGHLLVEFEGGVGAVDDRDLPAVCLAAHDRGGSLLDETGWQHPVAVGARLNLGHRRLPLGALGSESPPARFGFDPHPRPDAGEDACA